jgi:hypothetical protein
MLYMLYMLYMLMRRDHLRLTFTSPLCKKGHKHNKMNSTLASVSTLHEEHVVALALMHELDFSTCQVKLWSPSIALLSFHMPR